MAAVQECLRLDCEEVAELIRFGADVNAVRDDGESAITLAYKAEKFHAVRMLAAGGADISAIL